MIYPGLEGRNVLLISGHSNIGQHVTSLFAEAGANIVIAARDTARAEAVAAASRRFGKGSVRVVETDATSRESLEHAVHATLELGPLAVCYDGVGWHVPGRFLDLDPSLWDELYQINFRSVLLAYSVVLPILIAQRDGVFITMSSVLARRPTPTAPVYGALKSALTHLAQCIALDVAPYGVRVNVVAPGPTPPSAGDTVSARSSFRSMDPEALKERLKSLASQIPLQQLGEPENVAHAVLYLASPVTGAHQTGQVLGVDGGWWMPK